MKESNAAVVAGQIKPRLLVSVLVAVFIAAWGMLTVLVVLQDRMIDAQSSLIHTLFEKNALRSELKTVSQQVSKDPAVKPSPRRPPGSNASSSDPGNNDSAVQSSSAKAPSVQVPLSQAPLSQVPLSQDSSSQAPSSQVKPKSGDKSGRSSRKMRSPFSRPPAEITDPSDRRRVSISI